MELWITVIAFTSWCSSFLSALSCIGEKKLIYYYLKLWKGSGRCWQAEVHWVLFICSFLKAPQLKVHWTFDWLNNVQVNKYIVKKNYNIAIVGFCLLDKACYRCVCNADVMPCWDAELFSVVLSWFGPNYSQCETVLWSHSCSSSKGSEGRHLMITHNVLFSFASTRIYIMKCTTRSAFTFSKQNYTQN